MYSPSHIAYCLHSLKMFHTARISTYYYNRNTVHIINISWPYDMKYSTQNRLQHKRERRAVESPGPR